MKTLAEAARSLGRRLGHGDVRVVLPNIRSAVLSAAFLTVALVLGEYTIASLLNRTNLQVAIVLLGKSSATVGGRRRSPRCCSAFVLLLLLSLLAAAGHRPTGQDPHDRRTTEPSTPARPLRRRPSTCTACTGRSATSTRSTASTSTIAPGELVALLGPSGCGKTTALRVLAGLEDADAGRGAGRRQGRHPLPANRRDMGMVFQAYSLFPHLTALDNVEFGLRLRGRPRPSGAGPARCSTWSASARTRDRYPHQLSGGQQQRVALARALAIEPAVLLLDEPLSALDAKVRVQLRDEIRRIQTEVGTTTLFVTHDQEEALAVADRVGVMRAGRLEQLAPPAELYADPATPFVGRVRRAEQPAAGARRRRQRRRARHRGAHAAGLGHAAPASPWCGPSRCGSPRTTPGRRPSRPWPSSGRSRAPRSPWPTAPWCSPSSPSAEAAALAVGQRVRVSVDPVPVSSWPTDDRALD